MSSPGKFTVREVKKRSKKSRTLPVRLKLLNRNSSSSGNKSGTPPPRLKSSNLSIFRNADGEPWSFDLDAYGIYMDLTSPVRSVSKEELSSTRPKSVIGYEDEFNRVNRSKSLTRADAERQHNNILLNNAMGCSGLRSRSRSRLQNMNSSFTQCFGLGNDNSFEDEPEDYCEYDSEDFEFMTGEHYSSLRSRNTIRKLSFDDEDQYYPSG
jgi:hypothetical protein